MEFIKEPTRNMQPVLALVRPDDTQVLSALNDAGIEYEITGQNVREVFEDVLYQNSLVETSPEFFDYETKYHNYSEIVQLIHDLPKQGMG